MRDNEYFTDGMAEEIINALSKIQSLRVASRTSSFAFKGKNEDIGEIGKKLKVSTVLEGSVRKMGNKLRITAQLVNVADGYHLWSERYDREMEDVFEIQDDISQAIVKALRVILSEDEKKQIEKVRAVNVEAYDYYLRGRQYFHQFRRKSLEYARQMFNKAIEIDPTTRAPYAGVANCYSLLYTYFDARELNLRQADVASQKALELEPSWRKSHVVARPRGFAEQALRRGRAGIRDGDAARPQAVRGAVLVRAGPALARQVRGYGEAVRAGHLPASRGLPGARIHWHRAQVAWPATAKRWPGIASRSG